VDISIRQLSEDDWQLFRDIRLKGLKHDHGAFSARYETEIQKTDQEWQKTLLNNDTGIFAIFDGPNQIGITAIGIHWEDPEKKRALLWASWLEPAYRGKGISKLMYAARLNWAHAHPTCEKVVVTVMRDNLPSKRAIESNGFLYSHIEERRGENDIAFPVLHYELNL